ncbi:MAG: BON domain-containing protein [Thiogranum sp.]|nr:BON domain-containing protein [Thiogranum sp.]
MTLRSFFTLGALLAANVMLGGCAPAVVVGGAAATASVAHDRRTTGAVVEDQAIELRIKSALSDAGINKQAHINVTSYNAVVLLSGEAPSEALRSRAGDIARNAEKVRRVHNEVQIAAPSSWMTRSSDAWLTTKVKAALLKIKMANFDATRVKVVSENGTVYLMGMLTRAEAAAVTDQTQQLAGVQRIVKLFEYLD